MKTRAIAVASERSNAVGTVELECTPRGLALTYLGVGAFADGYAPGALTHDTSTLVPWQGILEADLEADRLFLHVDPALTPHNRLLLVHFSTREAPHPGQMYRRRLLLRLGMAVAFVLIVLVTGLTVPAVAPRAGAALVVVIGVTAAIVLLGMGILADHRLTHGGASSDAARGMFVGSLAGYLPHLTASPVRRPRPLEMPTIATLQALLPRSTAAIVITLSAALLAAILTSTWVVREDRRSAGLREPPHHEPEEVPAESEPPPPPPATSPPRATAPANAPTPAEGPKPAAVPPGGPCRCDRTDSILWRSKIPRLTTLLIERRERSHKDHVHLELEVGVVNNGRTDIDEVNLLVQFYERRPNAEERTPTHDRPLYFEGPLRPGQAIKWHVEARGTEFEVLHTIEGHLDPSGENAASADAFAELLKANHRPVRLHGAMMLGYLGDERAKDGAIRLREALREDEGPYLGRLLHALGDVTTCNLEATGKAKVRSIDVCVHNTTPEPRSDVFVRVRALDREFDHSTPVAPPPLVIAENTVPVGATIPAGSGVRVKTTLDTDNTDGLEPEMFEVFAGAERELY
jgi:hypothetical protein